MKVVGNTSICKHCGELPLSRFKTYNKNGRRYACNECRKCTDGKPNVKKAVQWWLENKEVIAKRRNQRKFSECPDGPQSVNNDRVYTDAVDTAVIAQEFRSIYQGTFHD